MSLLLALTGSGITGVVASSQAQSVNATGTFAGAITGIASSSQAQRSALSGTFTGDVIPIIGDGGWGIDHQIKRKKATLSDKPNEHLNEIIAKSFKEVFNKLTDKKAPKEVQKKANKIVSQYTDEYRPSVNQIDWFAFNQDLEAVQLLFNLYQREIADAKQIAENKRIFDLIENDNLEFLLMH